MPSTMDSSRLTKHQPLAANAVGCVLQSYRGTSAADAHCLPTVTGTGENHVSSTAEKELAAQDAKKVKGVVDVHNGLSVQ